MSERDTLEFYFDGEYLAQVKSSILPTVNSYISIKGIVYTVSRITFALDYLDDRHRTCIRANIDVTIPKVTRKK